MRDPRKSLQQRRTLLAGAGSVGALAAAVSVVPGTQAAATSVAAPDAKPEPDGAAGYRLTDHVKRYYASTRI